MLPSCTETEVGSKTGNREEKEEGTLEGQREEGKWQPRMWGSEQAIHGGQGNEDNGDEDNDEGAHEMSTCCVT